MDGLKTDERRYISFKMYHTQDKFITVAGYRTRYWEEGISSCPVILVHGLAACAEYWLKNFSAMAHRHRTVALDLLGFGKTQRPSIAYRYMVFVDFLKSFLDQMGIQKCILVGHSMGGGICLQFALDFPNRVKKLVLVSNAGFSHKIPLSFRLLSLPFSEKLLPKPSTQQIAFGLRQFVFDPQCIDEELLVRLTDVYQSDNKLITMANLLQHEASLFGIRKKPLHQLWKRLPELSCSTLVIWGRDDNLLRLKDSAPIIQSTLNNADLEIFEHCRHMPQIEHPEKFNQTVLKFLEEDKK